MDNYTIILLLIICCLKINSGLGSSILQLLPFVLTNGSFNRGQFNIAVFLDLQKAFDTINHNILIKKLDLYGLQKPALNLLGSYLENRFQM